MTDNQMPDKVSGDKVLREHASIGFGIPRLDDLKAARGFNEIYKRKVIVIDGESFTRPKGMSFSETVQTYLWACVFGQGPKVFKPTQLDFEALEHMDINISVADYQQPFPTVVIEIPKDYANKRTSFSSATEKVQSPERVILHHIPGRAIMGAVYTNGNRSYMTRLTIHDNTIQDSLNKLARNQDGVVNPDEEINFIVLAAAINACLIMDEVGVKKAGYMHQGYADQIQRRIDRRANVERNKEDLRLHPMMYGFAQEVKLFHTSNDPNDGDVGQGGGAKVCHWRRGHWRMQVHGPANSLRKRVRIKPVMVNKKFFMGEHVDTKVEYNQ